MSVQLSSRQKSFFIAIVFVVAGFMLVRILRVFIGGEIGNLIGISLGIIGALLAVWQVILAINANAEVKENSFSATLETIRKSSDDRDRYHEEILADIKTQIATITTQLEQHQQSLGHDGSIQHILQIKDDVSELKAAVAVLTRQGELITKIERIERELNALKGK